MRVDLRLTYKCPLCGHTLKNCSSFNLTRKWIDAERTPENDAKLIEYLNRYYTLRCERRNCYGEEMDIVAVD